MKKIIPYNDRITEKNLGDFADMLKDAAAARSYASLKAWVIGTDGTHEWAIAAGWPDHNRLEVRLAITATQFTDYKTSFTDTGTPADSHREYIEKDSPKPVITQQIRYFLDRFLEACGELPIAEPEQYEEPAAETENYAYEEIEEQSA